MTTAGMTKNFGACLNANRINKIIALADLSGSCTIKLHRQVIKFVMNISQNLYIKCLLNKYPTVKFSSTDPRREIK